MSELLPCPWCAGDARMIDYGWCYSPSTRITVGGSAAITPRNDEEKNEAWDIFCTACGARSYSASRGLPNRADAVARWNHRAFILPQKES